MLKFNQDKKGTIMRSLSAEQNHKVLAGSQPAILARLDRATWAPAINIVKNHAIAGRFLVAPIAFETFVSTLLDLPFSSLRCLQDAFNAARSGGIEGILLAGIFTAGSLFCALASLFAPIYALASTAYVAVKFLNNPLETAKRATCESELQIRWSERKLRRKDEIIKLPDDSRCLYKVHFFHFDDLRGTIAYKRYDY
jgi:hypothetical protein